MCRWLAYSGDPIPIDPLVFRRGLGIVQAGEDELRPFTPSRG